MINLKKVAAITLAATMCMGLGMTAFASTSPAVPSAGSPVSDVDYVASPHFMDYEEEISGVATTNGKGEQNNDLDLGNDAMDTRTKTWKSINTTPEVLDILKENGIAAPKGSTIIPIAYRQVKGISEDMANVITFTLEEGVSFSKDTLDPSFIHPGEEVWAMIETGENTGVWEMRSGKVNDNGEVDFTVDHKGAIILVKAMKNGEVVQFTKDSNGNDVEPPVIIDPTDPNKPVQPVDPNKPGTSTNPSNGQNANGGANAAGNAFTSPKTGEF